MKAEDIKKIAVIGSGTMGSQIAAQCALCGFETALYDISEAALEKAKQTCARFFKWIGDVGKFDSEAIQKAQSLLIYTADLEKAGAAADIISESVPEDPQLKGEVFAKLNIICPERTIFTTNTSTLLPSMFADKTGRPEKLAALHFHDLRLTDIVDVMPHPGTSSETIETVAAFAVMIGQNPIVLKKQSPGYVFNMMLSALFKSAQTLAANDVASVEDIDRAWMGVTRMLIGPFGLMDSVGIDTVHKITEYWAKKMNDVQGLKNAEYLKEYLDTGRLGQKTKKGFYDYPLPAYTRPDFVRRKFRD